MDKDCIYKLKIVDPLDDPIYRYRLTGDINWDKYWDKVGCMSSRVVTGVSSNSGLPVNASQLGHEARLHI